MCIWLGRDSEFVDVMRFGIHDGMSVVEGKQLGDKKKAHIVNELSSLIVDHDKMMSHAFTIGLIFPVTAHQFVVYVFVPLYATCTTVAIKAYKVIT